MYGYEREVMRPLKILIPLLFLLISFSCRSDNDVIAEMKSRRITRVEFHQWLRGRNIDPAIVYENPVESEKHLKQMAVEILAVESAIAEKFDMTPFYRNISRAVFANFLSSYYKEEIKKNLNYSEIAAEIKLIRLYFPADLKSQMSKDVLKDKMSLAAYIIQQYKSGVDFDELRQKYSEEVYAGSGKTYRIIPVVTLEKEISEKIKTLRVGECTAEPVVLRDSVVVVKLVRWLSLDRDNAEKLIDDIAAYNRFMDAVSEGAVEYIIAENNAGLKIVSNIERARFTGRNELLFSINNESFTSGDLADLLNLFIFLKGEEPDGAGARIAKRDIASNIFNEYLLSYLAEKKGISGSREFLDKWECVKKSTLAGAYKYFILSGKKGEKWNLPDEKNNKLYTGPGTEEDGSFSGKNSTTRAAGFTSTQFISIKSIWEGRLLDSNEFRIYKKKFY